MIGDEWIGAVEQGVEIAWCMVGERHHATCIVDEDDTDLYWLSLYNGDPDDVGTIGGTSPIQQASLSIAHADGCEETLMRTARELLREWVGA